MDDGRQSGKDRAAREGGWWKEVVERCVLEEDDGVDRVHVHNHKLHCLI